MAGTAEKPKKTKAPAKPKAEAAGTRKAATGSAKTGKAKPAAENNSAPQAPTHQEIARLAQQYWAERGHSDGHAEQDWLRAERELLKQAS